MTGKAGAGKGSGAGNNLGQTHPINIGANLYGVAACLAFLRMIFIFEIHHRYSIPTVVVLCMWEQSQYYREFLQGNANKCCSMGFGHF